MGLSAGWEIKKLPEVCEILDKYREPINNKERANRIEGKAKSKLFPYFGATGQVGFIDDYLLDGEFVLLGEDGAPFLEAFKSAAYLVSGKIWVNNHAHVLKAKKSNKFLQYYLSQIDYRDYVSGTTRLKLTQASMKNIEVPDPPLPTQQRIVEKIEELFSELDSGVESLKKAQKQLKTYRQAVLKDAFEGKLTAAWREQQTDLPTPDELLQQIKAEHKAHQERELAKWEQEVAQWEKNGRIGKKPRKPRKAKELDTVGKEDLSKLPEIPKNWMYVRIGNLGNVGTGATPLKKENSYYENGTIPWVTSGALNSEYVREASDFVTEKALNETNLSLFPKHTLLVAMYGEGKTRGKCSELLIEATTNQAIAAIVQNVAERKTKDFLKYYLLKNYNDIRRMSSGGVQPNLNLGIIESTIVPLAPEEEQKEIVNEIESRLSVVDQLEETIQENLQKSEALRQSILKKAFSGELVSNEKLRAKKKPGFITDKVVGRGSTGTASYSN